MVAFYGCTSLTSVTIPNSVKFIDQEAFSGCTGLTQIHNQSAVLQAIDEYVFEDVDKAYTLYVPISSQTAYQNPRGWHEFLNIVEEESDGIETVAARSLAIYPNPVTNGQLTIENGQLNDAAQIFDISGRSIGTLPTMPAHNGITINVSSLPAGVYMVKIGHYAGKFVKK